MSVEVALRPKPAETVVRFRIDRLRLLLVVNVVAILAVAIGLRVWRIGNIPGLNGDEAWSGVQAMRLVGGQSISWWTPTGNPVNPFFLGPLAVLHLLSAPSATLLRLPALVSGLAALAVNFLLCRRVFDRRVAWVSTLLLAVLPLNIAYSRFAWDASQSVLATTLVLFFALQLVTNAGAARRSLLPALLAYAAAIWIHPTNVFAGCLLVPPIVHCYRSDLRAGWQRFRASPLAGACGLLLTLGLLAAVWQFRPLIPAVFARIVSPAQWGLFLRLLVRLFSGSTVFKFIAGPPAGGSALDGTDLMFCCAAVAAGCGLLRVLRDPAAGRERCLALGSLGMAVSFFLIAGPAAIAPHAERYGACLIAPGALLMALGLANLLRPPRAVARWAPVALGLLAWLALGTFWWRYFALIEQTGGTSHLAFRTAAVEPKQVAWEQIVRQSGGRPAVVIADTWWLYWPLAYLAAGHRESRVVRWDEISPEDLSATSTDAVWLVEFCETSAGPRADERWTELRRHGRKTVINDYSGRPLLALIRAQSESTDN